MTDITQKPTKKRRNKGFTLSISQRILAGFAILIFFFMSNATFSLITLRDSAAITKNSYNVVNPSLEEIRNFKLLVTQSRMYTISWISSRTSDDDKDSLKKIHNDYPEFKDKLVQLQSKWENKQLAKTLDQVFTNFERLQKIQKEEIMNKIVEFDDYEDLITTSVASEIVDSQIFPLYKKIIAQLDQIALQKKKETENSQKDLIDSIKNQQLLTIILAVLSVMVGLGAYFITRRNIVDPIKYINSVFVKLGTGELPSEQGYPFKKDEIGEMADSAGKLVNGLRETSRFAESIGKGNYQASFTPLSDKDVLGNALLEMRDNLAKVAEEDRRRNWSTTGLARFGELVGKKATDLKNLSDLIISNLVKYVEANQGGLFIVEDLDNKSDEMYMSLVSCYAWDSKKYLEKRVYRGDGLTGQAWQEGETIHLTEIPNDYVSITSGLGEANPRSLLIVPLKLNEEVFGVVELASFNVFEEYEVKFVENIAESIASAIASVKTTERTNRLLDESTMMTEQMRSQEEEMRQNMEELQATQESTEKSQYESKEVNELLELTNLVIKTDTRFFITSANELTEAKLQYETAELKGMAIEHVFESYDKVEYAKSRLTKGHKYSEFLYLNTKSSDRIMVKVNAAAIRNEKGKIQHYLFLLNDISGINAEIA
ncbi:GAF domain-containing protein [uncultured Microscilla sp.]|uniref:GAF domain-containing protein n=1 Tax=uncultured Microscilla sp. TaxID=432653 RepID=UPI002604F7B0|nr:GAF domain-containing protein [uncultured Microscilla sp.]